MVLSQDITLDWTPIFSWKNFLQNHQWFSHLSNIHKYINISSQYQFKITKTESFKIIFQKLFVVYLYNVMLILILPRMELYPFFFLVYFSTTGIKGKLYLIETAKVVQLYKTLLTQSYSKRIFNYSRYHSGQATSRKWIRL